MQMQQEARRSRALFLFFILLLLLPALLLVATKPIYALIYLFLIGFSLYIIIGIGSG